MGRIHRPDGVTGSLAELFAALHMLHLRAGEPSMRQIAKETAALSYDTVHRVLTGPQLPRWGPLELVVEVLNGDVEEFRALWLTARIAESPETG